MPQCRSPRLWLGAEHRLGSHSAPMAVLRLQRRARTYAETLAAGVPISSLQTGDSPPMSAHRPHATVGSRPIADGAGAPYVGGLEEAMTKLPLSALLLVGCLLACSPSPREPLAVRELPTPRDLPHKFNEDCKCLQQNQCPLLEGRAGTPEVRNLTCRWLEPNKSAQCDFEERWVHPSHAEPWQARSLRAVAMADGRWCSAD